MQLNITSVSLSTVSSHPQWFGRRGKGEEKRRVELMTESFNADMQSFALWQLQKNMFALECVCVSSADLLLFRSC